MAYIKREDKADVVDEIAVYAIVAPTNNQVYVWKTLKRNLRSIYKDHYNLYYAHTKTMFQQAKDDGTLPPMFLLAELFTTQKEAFNHCIAWVKYFADYGYEVISNKNVVAYAKQPSDKQKFIYEYIKEKSIDEIVCDENNLFPDYGRVRQKKDSEAKSIISVPVKEEEYILIQNEAKKNSKTMAAFCRERILTGKTINFNFDFAMEYFDQMIKNRELLRQILYTIYSQKEYTKVDLENIQVLIDGVLENAKQINKEFKQQVKKLKENTLSGGEKR